MTLQKGYALGCNEYTIDSELQQPRILLQFRCNDVRTEYCKLDLLVRTEFQKTARLLRRETQRVAPIGAVIDWYPLLAPFVVPPGFIICQGQRINDPESPYNGLQAPDFRNRFARGIANHNNLHSTRTGGRDDIPKDGEHTHGGKTST